MRRDMSIKPLDMQVVLSQMDHAGSAYLKLYNAPRKEQILHGAEYEQRAWAVDHKVLDLPEDVSEHQESYLDPHDERKKPKDIHLINKYQKEEKEESSQQEEIGKGNLIDILS